MRHHSNWNGPHLEWRIDVILRDVFTFNSTDVLNCFTTDPFEQLGLVGFVIKNAVARKDLLDLYKHNIYS